MLGRLLEGVARRSGTDVATHSATAIARDPVEGEVVARSPSVERGRVC